MQSFAALKDHLGIGNDEVTADGKVSLEHIECNAACDYAPVVMANWEFYDNQTVESAKMLVDAMRAGNPPATYTWTKPFGDIQRSICRACWIK
jgi:NADH-quinone oxidoreductase subunit E